MNDKEIAKRKREMEKLRREAERSRCAVCGEKVTIEDHCSDGLFLHRHCAQASSTN